MTQEVMNEMAKLCVPNAVIWGQSAIKRQETKVIYFQNGSGEGFTV